MVVAKKKGLRDLGRVKLFRVCGGDSGHISINQPIYNLVYVFKI